MTEVTLDQALDVRRFCGPQTVGKVSDLLTGDAVDDRVLVLSCPEGRLDDFEPDVTDDGLGLDDEVEITLLGLLADCSEFVFLQQDAMKYF